MDPIRTTVLGIALAVFATGALAHEGGGCDSASCPDENVINAVRSEVAAACDCAGASSAAKYMRCVKGVVKQALAAGTIERGCRSAIMHCEGEVGCGRGIRPFAAVQQVFKGSCALATCHSTIARQGGLVLEDEEISYASLVDKPATLPEAAAQGLMRVVPGDPKSSFLVQKLRGKGPGDAMPQGTPPLSNGTIKVIEKWIKRGALSTEAECPPSETGARRKGRKACNNRPLRIGNYVWKPEPPLEAPAPGTGIQLYTPPRDIAPGDEWETCYAFRPDWLALAAAAGYPAGQNPIIKEQVYRMHEGSHHLLLYMYTGDHPEDWPEGYFPCQAANCIDQADCPVDSDRILPIGGTQVAGTRYEVKYPAGVGIPVLGAKAVLIANLHYTNPFQPSQPIYGESWLNLYFHGPGEAKAILDGIFAVNAAKLFVEPFQSRTISSVWQPRSILGGGAADAAVFQLFGHAHKRLTAFSIDVLRGGHCSASGCACGRDEDCACGAGQNRCLRDNPERQCVAGQTCVRDPGAEDTQIYYTAKWDHAPVNDYPAPYLRVARTEGLRWTCTHVNGVQGDPTRPPKICHEGCEVCGWNAATSTCNFCKTADDVGAWWNVDAQACFRGDSPIDRAPTIYQPGDPMPLVFGLLADDDMCNMFGYFINQADLPKLGLQ